MFRSRNLRAFVCALVTLVLVGAAGKGSSAGAAEPVYLLNPGDVLEISVWREEAMQRQILVLPDGMISFPLVGHLMAAGKTPEALQEELSARLVQFYPDPVVTVSVTEAAGNVIFVIGQVQVPGQFQVVRTIDIMQALSLAGGLTTFADQGEIKVLRRTDGVQKALPFDYGSVQAGRDLESNIQLKSGDVVVVPQEGLF